MQPPDLTGLGPVADWLAFGAMFAGGCAFWRWVAEGAEREFGQERAQDREGDGDGDGRG